MSRLISTCFKSNLDVSLNNLITHSLPMITTDNNDKIYRAEIMEYFLRRNFVVLLLAFPIFVQCTPEQNRAPETYWHNTNGMVRSYRSNFTIPILPTTRKTYATFVINNAHNQTKSKTPTLTLLDTADAELWEGSIFRDLISSTQKVSTTTPTSKTTPTPSSTPSTITSMEPTTSTSSDNSTMDQFLPINANNFSIKSIQSESHNELDDLEETFTYQVKRQNRNRFVGDNDILKKSELMQLLRRLSQGSDQLAHKNKLDDGNETMKKLEELESRVGAYQQRVLELESNIRNGQTKTNATIKDLQTKVGIIRENYRLNENATKEIRNALVSDKSRLEGQIHSLSTYIRNLSNSTGEKIQNVSSVIKSINNSIENVAYDVRMNDLKIRFNQKALTTLDKSVQSNSEKVMDLHNSVGPRWVEQTTGCGGVLVGDSGILSYKFRQPYLNNARCIWTVRVNRRVRVGLQLMEDGFQNMSNSDFITITEFTEENTLLTSSRIEHGNRAIHTFRGPLLFISFFSDGSTPGHGFTLKFHGQGNSSSGDSLNAVRYRHFHLKEVNGHVNYPEEKNVYYQPNEVATFAINPPTSPTTALRVLIRYTDIEKEENCEYDSVSFYQSVKASYALAKKYCDQQKSYNSESLQSGDGDGTFIVVFRSDGSTQFKGFQFSWDIL